MYMFQSTDYGSRTRLYFDGKCETFPTWEIRFIKSIYTRQGVHKAILQPREDTSL